MFALLTTAALAAQAGLPASVGVPVAGRQPGFDPKEVVRHVRHSPPWTSGPLTSGFDEGEFLIDTSVTYSSSSGYGSSPAVAFDGTNFFVVWCEQRGDYLIYGARVSPDGVLLDSAGIAVSTTGQQPAVSFDEASFLVVWTASGGSTSHDIVGARVTPGGVVLDPNGISISNAPNTQMQPVVASDGTNSLVVWLDDRTHCDIYGARVSQDGVVLDPAGIYVSAATHSPGSPAVAFNGTDYLVVWVDARDCWRDIYGARVSRDGTVRDTAGIGISVAENYKARPAVASDGAGWLVVWQDPRNDAADVYGARLGQDGEVQDTGGLRIAVAPASQRSPAVCFDNADFWVVWEDTRRGLFDDVCGARVSIDGSVLDTSGLPIQTAPGDQSNPKVAFGVANSLVVWDGWGGDFSISGARVTGSGQVLDSAGIGLSTASNRQSEPAVAFDGVNYFVAWQNELYGICGARTSQAGTMLDTDDIPISSTGHYPSVSFNGTCFLVVWQDHRNDSFSDVYGARVSSGGVLLDTASIAIWNLNDVQYPPVVASDGAGFLVVWSHWQTGSSNDVCGTRVSPDGVVLDTSAIVVSANARNQESPAVSFDGQDYVVVWDDSRSGDGYDVYGARVNRNGLVLDSNGIAISVATNSQMYPAVSSSGSNSLVVWMDGRTGFTSGIYGARVNANGVVLDPDGIAISSTEGCQRYPTVCSNGSDFLVVWEDDRNGPYDLYGAWVSPEGAVFDSGPLVRQAHDQLYPALASGPGNQMFLVYQGWAGTVGGKTYNTDRIWGKFGPFPGVAESRQPTAYSLQPMPTIVRGVLELKRLGHDTDSRSGIGSCPAHLLDIAGRKLLDLHAGANDVSRLAPGVYFVSVRSAASGRRSADAVRKVVIQR
jgi:hypothetical protein